jgi:hypothetical protein
VCFFCEEVGCVERLTGGVGWKAAASWVWWGRVGCEERLTASWVCAGCKKFGPTREKDQMEGAKNLDRARELLLCVHFGTARRRENFQKEF